MKIEKGLPKEWKVISFGEIASFKNGANFRSTDTGYKYKMLGVGDFKDNINLTNDDELKSISVSSKPHNDAFLRLNDLVFVRSNGSKDLVGRCLNIKCELNSLIYSGFCIRARLHSDVTNSDYVNLLLQNGVLKKQLLKDGRGTNISNLNQDILAQLNLIIPTIPEQKDIVNLLSTWDEVIEKTEKLIQEKEWVQSQMSRDLLFGKKRIGTKSKELFNGIFFKYPSDWHLVKVGKIAKEVSVRNGETKEVVLSCSKYDGFVNSLDYFGKQVFSNDTSNYKVVNKGQFGYPSNHVEEGSIGLLQHCEKGIVSPIYVVFEVLKGRVHLSYLYKLLKTDIYRHIFQVCTSSSVDRRGSLRWNEFSKIKVLIPAIEEQVQIVETLSLAQKEIDLLKQLVEKYKTQKRGLMQKLLTGEWRIREGIK